MTAQVMSTAACDRQLRPGARLVGYLSFLQSDFASSVSAASSAMIDAGVDRFYMDVDRQTGELPQLDAAIEDLGQGDFLVSPALKTLTRSIAGLIAISHRLDAIGASLRVLHITGNRMLDTATAEGRAILGALEVMTGLEPEGAQIASPAFEIGETRSRGRPATAFHQSAEVSRLRSKGLRAVEIAACLGIGRASVYRILSQHAGAFEPAATPTRPAVSPFGVPASNVRLHVVDRSD